MKLATGRRRPALADRLGLLLLALAATLAFGLGGAGCGPQEGLPDGILPTLVSYEPTHATSGTGGTTGTASSVSISAFDLAPATVSRGSTFRTTISVENKTSTTYSAATALTFTRASAPTDVAGEYTLLSPTTQAITANSTTKLLNAVSVGISATTGPVTIGGTVTLTRTGETKQLKLTPKSITVTF